MISRAAMQCRLPPTPAQVDAFVADPSDTPSAVRTFPVAYTMDGDKYIIAASKGGADTHPGAYARASARRAGQKARGKINGEERAIIQGGREDTGEGSGESPRQLDVQIAHPRRVGEHDLAELGRGACGREPDGESHRVHRSEHAGATGRSARRLATNQGEGPLGLGGASLVLRDGDSITGRRETGGTLGPSFRAERRRPTLLSFRAEAAGRRCCHSERSAEGAEARNRTRPGREAPLPG